MKQMIDNVNVMNLSQKVFGEVEVVSPHTLYSLYKQNKIFTDNINLQRILMKWLESKTNSYLFTMINGASLKDTFQLAEVEPILEELKIQLKPNAENFSFIEENIKYFSKIKEDGYLFILLDGQHRLDTIVRYFDGQVNFKPTEPIALRIQGEQGTVYVKGKFDKLPEVVQDHIMHNIKLLTVRYKSGDLRELVRIFITANSMKAMTKHEKRILNYNEINRWLNDTCVSDVNMKKMFKNVKSMENEYSLDAKGDTLFVAEMLLYMNNNYYSAKTFNAYDTDVLDDVLGPYPSGNINISSSEKELTKRIFKIMADGCVPYDLKKLRKFTKSTLYNMFYTLSFIYQKGNVWGKKKDIDGKYKVANDAAFVKWFLDKEFERINAPGTKIVLGVGQKPQTHNFSFRKHNEDQKHERKSCTKGEGGSKYTFTNWARVQYLLEDLNSDLRKLEKIGVISKVGSRDDMSRDEALAALNVPLSESDNVEINEILPVSKGGKRVIGNIEALTIKENRVLSNRVRRID